MAMPYPRKALRDLWIVEFGVTDHTHEERSFVGQGFAAFPIGDVHNFFGRFLLVTGNNKKRYWIYNQNSQNREQYVSEAIKKCKYMTLYIAWSQKEQATMDGFVVYYRLTIKWVSYDFLQEIRGFIDCLMLKIVCISTV